MRIYYKKLIWDSVDVGSYLLLIFKASRATADMYTRLPLAQAVSLPQTNVGIKPTEH